MMVRHCDRTQALACPVIFSRYKKGEVSPHCCISGKKILVRIWLRRA